MKWSQKVELKKGTCDVVKLIAALLVVTAHAASAAIGMGSEHPFFYVVASQNGYIGVAIFFFLSGYGLMQSEMKSHLPLEAFFRRRFLKVYLPVLLVTALWLPLIYNYPSLSNGCNSVIYDLFYTFADPVMWFIRVLVPLYAAFYLMSMVGHRWGMDIAVWLLLAGCVAYAITSMCGYDSVRDHSVPLFAMGVFAAFHARRGVGFNIVAILLVGMVVSLPVFFTSHPLTGFMHSYFDYCVLAALVAILSIRQIDVKLPAVLAAITFDIYLVHMKLLMVGARELSLPVLLVAIIPATFAFSWLFMKLRTAIIDNGIMKLFNRL